MSNKKHDNAFILQIVVATFQILDAKSKDKKVSRTDVLVNFLAQFVGNLVYKALMAPVPSGMTAEQRYDAVQKNYGDLKFMIQEAVSAGFSGAMSKYSGQGLEFYTQIKVASEEHSNKKDI